MPFHPVPTPYNKRMTPRDRILSGRTILPERDRGTRRINVRKGLKIANSTLSHLLVGDNLTNIAIIVIANVLN